MQLRNANHRYQSYDYGKGENLKVYGTEEPPLFPIGNIVTPVLMVSSYNDTLVALKVVYDEKKIIITIDFYDLCVLGL